MKGVTLFVILLTLLINLSGLAKGHNFALASVGITFLAPIILGIIGAFSHYFHFSKENNMDLANTRYLLYLKCILLAILITAVSFIIFAIISMWSGTVDPFYP